MNNPLVDEIQRLSDCRSHAERAEWLLTVPLSVLSHYEMTIRNRLQIGGFHEGVDYLEHELIVVRSRRFRGIAMESNEIRRQQMTAIAASLPDQSDPPPVPDPSITDL